MRVKKFQAKDMAEAMKMVKADLGANAIILHTRDTGKGLLGWLMGKGVEVTATVDNSQSAAKSESSQNKKPKAQPPRNAHVGRSIDFKVSDNHAPKPKGNSTKTMEKKEDNPLLALSKQIIEDNRKKEQSHNSNDQKPTSESITPEHLEKRLADMELRLIRLTGLIEHLAPSLASGEIPSVPPRTRDLYNHLLEQEVDEHLALSIAAKIAESTDEGDDVWTALKTFLISKIQIGPSLEIDFNAKKPKIIMLVGPTGVGKTTSLAKISAQYRYAKNAEKAPKIVFITADLYRLAAVEQLHKYTEILGTELEVTYSPEEVRQALKKHQDANLILFDTAGACQRNLPQMSTLSTIVEATQPTEVHLVLSATTKYSDLIDIVEHFKEVKPSRFLFTKIDESTTFGPMLNTLQKYKIPLSYLTTGQNVPEDIEPARAERIAKLLLTKPMIDRSIEDSNSTSNSSQSENSKVVVENQEASQDKNQAKQDKKDETTNS